MIDETVASYRKVGLLVELTSIGNVIVELPTLRRIELHPHQVDVAAPHDFNFIGRDLGDTRLVLRMIDRGVGLWLVALVLLLFATTRAGPAGLTRKSRAD